MAVQESDFFCAQGLVTKQKLDAARRATIAWREYGGFPMQPLALKGRF
jgi:hypothetical protein